MRPMTPSGSRVISTSTPGPHGRELLARDADDLAREEPEDLPGARRLADALRQRLAFLARQQRAEFVLAREDLGSDPVEDVRALLDGAGRPRAERLLRGRDRGPRLRDVGLRVLADDVARVRRIAVDGDARARQPLAADVVPEEFRHVDRLRCAVRREARIRRDGTGARRALGLFRGSPAHRAARGFPSARPRRTSTARSRSDVLTRLTSAPSAGVAIVTMSPTTCVKPWPGPWRSCVGANIVPRNSTRPSGYWWLAPIACADEVERIAADLAIELDAVEREAVRARRRASRARSGARRRCRSARRTGG